MTLRKLIFWPHLVVGLLAGLVILVMAVTGVLLTYEKQIVRWSEWDRAAAAAPAGAAERLPVDAVIAKVSATAGTPSNVTVYADPGAPLLLSFGRDKRLFVNAYTGDVIGAGSPRFRAFFRTVTDIHRWLGAHGTSRAAGKAVTGACNLAFLFLVVSGVYLWFPRKWSWASVKAVTVPRLRAPSGKARDWNWHNALGAWAAAPLFLVVLSGVVISYSWAGDLVYRVVGSEPPPRRAAGGSGGGESRNAGSQPTSQRATAERPERREGGERGSRAGRAAERAEPAERDGRAQQDEPRAGSEQQAGVRALWNVAERQRTDWTSISHAWPLVRDGKATFTLDTGAGAQPQHKTQLTLDAASAAVVKAEGWADLEKGRKARSVLRFTHTGEILGLPGQTIAGVTSLAAAVLVYTGFALSWRRFFARRKTSDLATARQPDTTEVATGVA